MPIITVKNVDLPILIAYHMDGTISMLFFCSHIFEIREVIQKKREYIRALDLKEGGDQFENLIFK